MNGPDGIDRLAEWLHLDSADMKRVADVYPVRINRYFGELLRIRGESIARQVVPDPAELSDDEGLEDPLGEEQDSPVPHLTHKYPDRVLLLVTTECAVFCRFCTRKRKIGRECGVNDKSIGEGIRYIRDHSCIRDVLVSGGDPLMLSDARLEWILSRIREIPHVEIIRIGTRIPSAMPGRVTPRLAALLSRFHPLYLNLHFNHPDEITRETAKACGLLADAGIPLGSQTVLLKGVNDHPDCMETLIRGLLRIRVQPYYLLQADLARGTGHFRTAVGSGLRIMAELQKRLPVSSLPVYVVDLPEGGGKVPLGPGLNAQRERPRGTKKPG
ncbi:KamA family radical SAM protein [bacterium]|nr:KamA family radical SAM protein [bacterium]